MKKNYKYRLFGRSKGRNKNIKLSEEALAIKISSKVDPQNYNVIDIGPGYGESTLEIAINNNKKNIFVCEKYIDGINKIAKNTTNNLLTNVSIFQGNVHQFLDDYCLKQSISEIWILFPDPWPKNRHAKRRLINLNFFMKIKNFLKKNAIIHIASDSKVYVSEILNTTYQIKKDFKWINQSKEDWNYSNLPLPKTKYFQKAQKKGLKSFYLNLIKL